MHLCNSNILYFLALKYMWKHQTKVVQQILNAEKNNQSYIYFQSTSNKHKPKGVDTLWEHRLSTTGRRILLPPAGNTGCYTTPKDSSALHRDNLSELLQKRHLWSQQNFSIILLLTSLSSWLRVTQRNPPISVDHYKQEDEGVSPYPGCEVDCSSAVQQQRGHIDIAIVRGDVQRSEATLQRETAFVTEIFLYKITNLTRTWF